MIKINPAQRKGRHLSKAFVIVAVLWLLAALRGAGDESSRSTLSNSARAARAQRPPLCKAEALVSAGVELTAYQLQLRGPRRRAPALGSFHTHGLNGREPRRLLYLGSRRGSISMQAPKRADCRPADRARREGRRMQENMPIVFIWLAHQNRSRRPSGTKTRYTRVAGRPYSPRPGAIRPTPTSLASYSAFRRRLVERAWPCRS